MLERSIYVRGLNNNPIGMVTVIEDEGRFGIGWSICNELDKFNREEAKRISRERAVKDHAENIRWFKDVSQVTEFEDLGITLPPVKTGFVNDFLYTKASILALHEEFDYTLRRCIREVIYTCALQYLKNETKERPQA